MTERKPKRVRLTGIRPEKPTKAIAKGVASMAPPTPILSSNSTSVTSEMRFTWERKFKPNYITSDDMIGDTEYDPELEWN